MAILLNNRTRADILRDGAQRLQKNVGITADNTTATARNLQEVIADEFSNTWSRLNNLIQSKFLTTANGSDLDETGVFLQERRIGAKRAMDLSASNVAFSLDTNFATNITDLLNRYYTKKDLDDLLAGGYVDSASSPTWLKFPRSVTVLSEDGQASYNTMEEIQLTNNQLIDYTPVIANGVGDFYNIGPNTLTRHNLSAIHPILSKLASAIRVTNKFAIANGGTIESDDNYRFRLSNKLVTKATGNEAAIRQAVLSVPGVVDMGLIKRSHGASTFTIFPRSADPIISDGLINAVAESVESVKSVGEIAYVMVPTYLGVTMKLSFRFAPGADQNTIFGQAKLVVMDYINNLNEGGEIIINEIIQRVMSVSDLIIDMIVVEFGYGTYDRNTGLLSGYNPLRLVNQIADWNEKWYCNSKLCQVCVAGSQ